MRRTVRGAGVSSEAEADALFERIGVKTGAWDASDNSRMRARRKRHAQPIRRLTGVAVEKPVGRRARAIPPPVARRAGPAACVRRS